MHRRPEKTADADQRVDSPTGGTKNDRDKPDLYLLMEGCPLALMEAAKVMTFGAKKYGKFNWKNVERERYLSALQRHMLAYHVNQYSLDSDTNQSHLSHALTNLLFLVQLEQESIALTPEPTPPIMAPTLK